jgi:UDP-N-acetylmuramoyl-L-alanyl-D-glutamate--2,6-diaminopimelate ligase
VSGSAPIGLTLGELADRLRDFQPTLRGDPGLRVSDVDQDSRHVRPGALFAARQGGHVDGLRFVADARSRGAVAVMLDSALAVPELDYPSLCVRDLPRAVAFAAEAVHADPSRALKLAGITGTNGKTTVAWLVQRTLEAVGVCCGRLGTLGFDIAGRHEDAQLTTPEADSISRSLAEMRRLGATHAVMEVSSVALKLARVEALRFEVAAFSNLTHDHLDFHGSFEAYRDAKARLFQELSPAVAVLNVDDAFGSWLAAHASSRVLTVGASLDCDISGAGLVALPAGVSGTLRVLGRELQLSTRLVGRHNAENIMLAFGVMSALGADLDAAALALSGVPAVPGRLERCDGPADDCIVLVDYAHTPDALERVLAAVAPPSPARLICVFGCGGDRDPQKRFPMGRAVGERAHYAIVTNDNPRSEAPEAIAAAVELGLRAAGANYEVCLDREQAIERAVSRAQPGDVLLIAGKGHETYQIMGPNTLPFDDREQARLALARRRDMRQGLTER